MNSMCVIASSSVPIGVRGALNQWFLEVLPGVFVGRVSARVRDELWSVLTVDLDPDAYAVLAVEAATEQGFTLRRHGPHPYQVTDHGGMQLVTITHGRANAADQAGEASEFPVPW